MIDADAAQTLLAAEVEADAPEDWIQCAQKWHSAFGREADTEKRRCLVKAEEDGINECPVALSQAWLRLFPYDGASDARRVMTMYLDLCDTFESAIEGACECLEALGDCGLSLAERMLRRSEEMAWESKEWEACADAWARLPANRGHERANWCKKAAEAARGGDLSDFLISSGYQQ